MFWEAGSILTAGGLGMGHVHSNAAAHVHSQPSPSCSYRGWCGRSGMALR